MLPDGARYTGEVITIPKIQKPSMKMVLEKVPQGKGKILYTNGDKYKGKFQDGVPNG